MKAEALQKGCPSVTVIVPAYNEEGTIGQVLSELTKIGSKASFFGNNSC